MPISSEVLIKWSKPGKSENSKITYEKLKNVINSKCNGNYEIFLQGSYNNDTYIKENSDIDVVVLNEDVLICNNLSMIKGNLNDLSSFKSLLYYRIQSANNFIFTLGNKTIKYVGNTNYVPADIVPCACYKETAKSVQMGTIIYDTKLRKYFINYPKQHYNKGVSKSNKTNGNFKKAVRMFKNARNDAVKKRLLQTEDIAPSYFLECLIYNIPNDCFNGNEYDIFYKSIYWLYHNKNLLSNMKCQNEIQNLFGYDNPNKKIIYNKWNTGDAITFINAIASLWDNWGKV